MGRLVTTILSAAERCNVVAILEGLGVMFTENGKLKLRVEQDRT